MSNNKGTKIGGLENLKGFMSTGYKAQEAVNKEIDRVEATKNALERKADKPKGMPADYVKRHYVKPDYTQRMVDLYGAAGTCRRLGETYVQTTLSKGIKEGLVLKKYEDACQLYWLQFMEPRDKTKVNLTSRSEQLKQHEPESALLPTQQGKGDAFEKIKQHFTPKPIMIESVIGVKFNGLEADRDQLVQLLSEIDGVEVTIIQ